MDKLDKMMEMQEYLNTNVINKIPGMLHYRFTKLEGIIAIKYSQLSPEDQLNENDRLKREWADNFMSALQSEICETREALTQRVKWWKSKVKDQDGVEEEIVDCFHFLMAAALAMGMTSESIFKRYCDKNKENLTRSDWTVNK